MRKVCIFTSTRAEWGLLRGVADQIRHSKSLRLQVLVSGSHLSEKFGKTVSEIEADGFLADAKVEILKYDDTPSGICKTMGLAISLYGEVLDRLRPDILVLLGDRYEAFCAAVAAQIQRIPVSHIHGGETTEGAVDEAFRHSITKMAHLHFASCKEYCNRIIQLGEDPFRVFNVGALGVENIRKIKVMSRNELESSIGFQLDKPFFLVTFHPVTLEEATASDQFNNLLGALDKFPGHKIIFTKANADAEGQLINALIDDYVAARPERCLALPSLGAHRYLSALKLCEAVVGNSSSGILEAPVFEVPTVNIGDRQKGRIRTKSVLDCDPTQESIFAALNRTQVSAFREGLKGLVHPCEKQDTARSIVQILETVSLKNILKKSFFNMEVT